MQLLRKWNPESAPILKIPHGPNVYRIVAIIKDGIHDHWICFYDRWTEKVYLEEALIPHSGSWNYSHCRQVQGDTLFVVLVNFLKSVDVLSAVSKGYQVDKDILEETGEVVLSPMLSQIPKTPYGVDNNGSQVIGLGMSTQDILRATQSPSEWSNKTTGASKTIIS